MRYFLPFLFSMVIGKDFPKTIEGNYTESFHGMIGRHWSFSDNGTFTISEENCEGGRKGMGNYTMDNDSIHLLFGKYPHVKQNSVAEITKIDSTAGMMINFRLTDIATGEEMVFVNIVVTDSSGNNLASTLSDIDGHGKISVDHYNGTVHIKILYIGYDKTEFSITGSGTYSIKVKMASNFGPSYIAEGTHEDYKIISMSKAKMVWQLTFGTGPEEFELTRE